MTKTTPNYIYHRGKHGIFVEIYFPKRIAAQGIIFEALERGYKEDVVKKYLQDNITKLLEELKAYQQIFDPRHYNDNYKKRKTLVSEAEAKERINNYKSTFKGWSNYDVGGVWFDEDEKSSNFQKPIEEATQILRLMFRFESSFVQDAEIIQYQDVLRAIIFWTITKQALINERSIWDKYEQDRFIKQNGPWSKNKLNFVKKFFTLIAKEVAIWMDDCWLFMFGYLIRQFSEKVLEIGRPEKEIWVTSFFNLNINIMKYEGN